MSTAAPSLPIRFVTSKGMFATISDPATGSAQSGETYRLSQYWNYVISNRRRFDEKVLDTLVTEAGDQFKSWGIGEEFLEAAAKCGRVEIHIPFSDESTGYAWRVMPWESMMNLAVRPWCKGWGVTLVRHLDRGSPSLPLSPLKPEEERLLFVSSAPGRISEVYEFETECKMICNALRARVAEERMWTIRNPTLPGLLKGIVDHTPSIVHLTALDVHQAAEVLHDPDLAHGSDGVLFVPTPPGSGECRVEADALGAVLIGGGEPRPRLVAFNCQYSASRLAAMTVAAGIEFAIGFQDSIDDSMAEQFYVAFYREWSRSSGDMLRAFHKARRAVAGQPGRNGAGTPVLWSARSLIEPNSSSASPDEDPESTLGSMLSTIVGAATHPTVGQAVALAVSAYASHRRGQAQPPGSPPPVSPSLPPPGAPPPGPAAPAPKPPPRDLAQEITVKAVPERWLNYAHLHNAQPIFQHFCFSHELADTGNVVNVVVELNLGETTCKFSGEFLIDDIGTDPLGVAKDIHLPLVAKILRDRRESLQTTLRVEVQVVRAGRWTTPQNPLTIYQRTHQIALLSADEWTDDDLNRRWLPSFILPKDPAVQRILDAAVPYLRVLADDASAGFDGYQRQSAVDTTRDFWVVDNQVRAIWAALLYSEPLAYINPPPTYTPRSQRLRIPSQIMAEHRATCVDAALLIAACLEYVGIMPVVFLIPGHAFVGYWRTISAWTKFREFETMRKVIDNLAPDSPVLTGNPGAGASWMRVDKREVMQAVQDGGLVPLEATEVTRRGSFASAVENGTKWLLVTPQLDAMVEVTLAREKNITPLPIVSS